MSGTGGDVVLLTPDAGVASAVDAALNSNGRVWNRTSMHGLRELPLHLSRGLSPIVLVDLDPQPRQVLDELERITGRFPATRVVALASQLSNELLLSAMQSGVRHVVIKQTIPADLMGVLNRLVGPGAPAAGPRGTLIVLLSASGGCGATTVAVNLADELCRRDMAPTLLVDLDTTYGTLATYLGLEPRYGIDHVLSYQGPIDAHLLSSTASARGEHLHVLPSPASVSFSAPAPLAHERLEQFLDVASLAYRHVVVDAPRVSMPVAATLASAATRTLLVFQLTVKDIRVARSMLAALTERGVPLETVTPLVTRYARRQHMIGLDEASTALNGMSVECVRNDYQSAVRAMNFGQPLSEAAPRSSLRRDLQELTTRLAPSIKA